MKIKYLIMEIKAEVLIFADKVRNLWRLRHLAAELTDDNYLSVLKLERYQLNLLRRNILRRKNRRDWDYTLNKIELCIALLDITMISNECIYKKYKDNTMNVNIKNIGRFNVFLKRQCEDEKKLNSEVPGWLKREIYEEKAWHLYHKIKTYYMRDWY